MRRLPLATAVALLPGAARAHDAFGDLGPFYATLLHPLADPAQGLILAAIAVFLARQPLDTMRLSWPALAIAGALAIGLGAVIPHDGPGLAAVALAAVVLGLLAMTGTRIGTWPSVALTLAAGATAGLAIDLPAEARAAGLAAFGGAVGIALAALFLWGFVDLLQRRLGRVAGAVAGSWVAAVGVMAAAFSFTIA